MVATSTHSVAFTTESVVPASGVIHIAYPSSFDLSGAILGPTSGFGGTGIALTVVDSTIVLSLSGPALAAGPLGVDLVGVVHPTVAGDYAISVETLDGGASSLEGPVSSPDFTLLALPPSALRLSAASPSVVAGDSLLLTVTSVDIYDNPSEVGADQSLSPLSTSPAASYHLMPGGAATGSLLLASGTSSLDFHVRDTRSGTPTLSVLDPVGDPPDLGFAQLGIGVLPGPVDAAVSSASTSAAATADGIDIVRLDLGLRDVFGNAVAGLDSALIEISVSGAGNAVDGLSASSDPSGEFSANLRTLEAGQKTVTIIAGGTTLDDQPTASFSPRAPDGALSSVGASGSAVADGVDPIDVTITLRDALAREISGIDAADVEIVVLDGPASVQEITLITAADGIFQAQLRSTSAGSRRVSARINGAIDLTDMISVDFVAGPVSASRSTIIVPGISVADGISFVTATVGLRDANDNAVAGLDSAQIQLTLAGVGWTIEKLAAASAGDGRLAARIRSVLAGSRALDIVAEGTPLDALAFANFSAGTPSAASSSATMNVTAVADGSDVIAIDITLRDALGNPVAGTDSAAVGVSITGSLNDVRKLASTTNATGHLPVEIRSLVAEDKTVDVDLLGVPIGASTPVQFLPGGLDALVLDVGAGNGTAGVAHVFSLEARDAAGNRITGFTGTVALSTDTGGPGGNVSWSSLGNGNLVATGPGTADYSFDLADGGLASFEIMDTRAESIQLSALAFLVEGSAGLDVAPAAPNTLSLVAGDAQSGPVAAALPAALRVEARDAFGNGVSGRTIDFVASADGQVDCDLTLAGIQSSVVTDVDGAAVCEQWTLGSLVGAQSVQVSADFGPVDQFSASATPGPMVELRLEPNGAIDRPASSALAVAAFAGDAFGNGIAGVEITVFVVDALDGILAGVGETDSLGVGQQRGTTGADGRVGLSYVAASSAGASDVLDAAAPGFASGSVIDLVVTATEASATDLAIDLPATPVRAGQESSLDIRLIDGFGNDTPGESADVRVSADVGSGIAFSAVAGGPYSNPLILTVTGARSVWWVGGPVGRHEIVAADEAFSLAAAADSVDLVAALLVDSYLLSSPAAVVAGADFSQSVQAFDAWGNPALESFDGFTIDAVLAADSTVVATTPPAVTAGSLSGGSYSTDFQRLITAERVRLRVNAAGRGYLGPEMDVLPAALYELVSVTPDTLSGIIAGDAVDMEIELRDAFGNPVIGAPVSVRSVQGGVVEIAPPASDANGRSTARLRTGALVGSARLVLGILDGNPATRETAALVALTRSGPIAELQVLPAAAAVVAGDALPIEVEARDLAGNLVDDATDAVDLIALGPGSGVSAATASLLAGRLTISASDSTVGSFTVAAALSADGNVNGVSSAIDVLAGALHRVEAVGSTSFSTPAAGSQLLTVRTLDRFDNPTPASTVLWELLSDPGGAVLSDADLPFDDGLALTDAAGLTAATLDLSAVTGAHQIRASILDRNPPGRESVAFTVDGLAGGAASIALALASSPLVAGASTRLDLELLDAAGNVVPLDGDVSLVFAPVGATASPDPVVLVAGVGSTDVTAFTAGALDIQAIAAFAGGASGTLDGVAVLASTPDGVIPVPTVDPAINTANGLAVTRLVAGPVRDSWGNIVAQGSTVDVTANGGALISEDADAIRPGLQRLTDAAGQLEARLVSPIAPAAVQVGFASAAASGSAIASFESPAELRYDGGLSPAVVAPGQSLVFSVQLRNDGDTDASLLAAASSIQLDDGAGGSFVAALSADTAVAAGGSVTLNFVPQILASDFQGGARRPLLLLAGQDEHGQAVAAVIPLPDGALAVSNLAIRSVTHAAEAAVGGTVDIHVEVENVGAAPSSIAELLINGSPASDFQLLNRDPLPAVAPGSQVDHVSRYLVGPGVSPGSYRFVARITGNDGDADFAVPPDSSATPMLVTSAAVLAVEPGGLDPIRFSRGAAQELRVQIRNSGGAAVLVDERLSYARIQGASASWNALLPAPLALGPGGVTELVFGPTLVDPALETTAHDVRFHLEGTEAGRAFATDLLVSGAVTVQTPAQLSLPANPLSPTPVVLGDLISFSVRVQNDGEAAIQLDPLGTALRMGEPAGTRLGTPLDAATTVLAGDGESVLDFAGLGLPLDLVVASPPGFVELRGTQNGLAFSLDVPLPDAALVVQSPAGLRILETVALHPRAPSTEVNAAQRIPVRVVVSNAGDEGIDSLTVSLVGSAAPASTSPPQMHLFVAPASQDTFHFDVDVTTSFGAETLRASITRAVSSTTGAPVLPLAAADDVASLLVQRPVSLAFTADLPEAGGANSASVSPGQVVALRLRLSHAPPLDAQGDWAPVDVGIDVLSPFTLDIGESLPLTLSPALPERTIRIVAPEANGLSSLTARLSESALDLNEPTRNPLVSAITAVVQLDVSGGTSFELCALGVSAPAGAMDGVVSSGQDFVVQAELTGPPNLIGRSLEIVLPPELALVGGNGVVDLAFGTSLASWTLRAPASAASALAISLRARATDAQSDESIDESCAPILIDAVGRAGSAVVASYSSPASAVDRGQIPPGAELIVEAGFELAGQAGVTGPGRVRIEVPAGFTRLGGTPLEQDVADAGTRVQWHLQAPDAPSESIQTIGFLLVSSPVDENSGLTTGDPSRRIELPIATVASPLRLAVGDVAESGTIVGSTSYRDRIELILTNGNAAPVRWIQLAVEIVDAQGVALTDPAAVLSELRLEEIASGTQWSASVFGRPVMIDLDSLVPAGETRSFRLAARATPGAPQRSFAFALDAGAAGDLRSVDDFAVPYSLSDLQGLLRPRIIVGRSITAPSGLVESAHSYPNPFVPSREDAVVAYTLPEASRVDIEIFDLLGNIVRSWAFDAGAVQAAAGVHDGDVRWDGRNGAGADARNGVYVCRIRAAGKEAVFRIGVTR